MSRLIRTLLVTAALIALALSVGSVASAHKKPGDIRAKIGCNTILKPAKRKACKACVTKAAPHHFHPAAAAGNRCRPNNGKP